MKSNIEVTVKLFAQYREGKFKIEKRTYPEGSTAKDIIEDIGLDIEKFPIGVLIVNGRHVGEEHILNDGDNFSIFPKVGGG